MERMIRNRLLAERPPTSWIGLTQPILGACRALERAFNASGPWTLGQPPSAAVEISETAIGLFVRRVERQRRQGIAEVCSFALMADPEPISMAVSVLPYDGVPYLWFGLPDEVQTLARLPALVRDVAEAFGAYNACVEDERLLGRYVLRRTIEREREIVPPEYQRYVGELPVYEDSIDLDMLLPNQFDRQRVPTGVWWVNYWSGPQVATLGEQRVRSASWARVIDMPDGALVLVPTEEQLDSNNRAHLARLRRIIDEVGLHEAQERARYLR